MNYDPLCLAICTVGAAIAATYITLVHIQIEEVRAMIRDAERGSDEER
jgi:hypothetical protein